MKKIAYLLLLSGILFSCKHDKKEMLVKTWHGVKLENPQMDSFFTESQMYLDTVGKGHDDASNMALYGVTNMDSLRHVMQQQLDSAKEMQMSAVKNTIFNFRKDSVVILTFSGNVDSSKWYFDTDGSLVLDELSPKQPGGDKVKMEVLALSDTVLKLKFAENGSSSTVTFHPGTN